MALAQRVQELSRYRSDFFGRLRQILGDRPDIRVVGDRFVFQSEVLFATGSADINDQGKVELDKVASAIVELITEIPEDIHWVLQINGHTDKQPISGGGRFKSNWELSAARAISVVEFFISQGIPPDRLVAAGYGEYQPLVEGDTPEAYAQNRRIELKLTVALSGAWNRLGPPALPRPGGSAIPPPTRSSASGRRHGIRGYRP